MGRVKKVLSEVEWYTELQEIRERLSIEKRHLEKIADFNSKGYASISDMRNRDLTVMFNTLLLSYPALAKTHFEIWDDFRQFCAILVEGDVARSTLVLTARVLAVVDDNELESLHCMDDPDHPILSEPFDYLDMVLTLKDNKGKKPFNLIQYDEDRLDHVVETIRTINIEEVIKGWLELDPSSMYPEVQELSELLSIDDT